MPSRQILFSLLLLLVFGFSSQAQQQPTNLLQNPGFEQAGNYVDQRPSGSTYAFAIAPSWNGWMSRTPSTASWMNIEPIAYPHSGSSRQEGYVSQNIGRGDATWTAAIYQTIPGIADNTGLRFSVWVFHDSQDGSGTQTRVGIGSNVGGNPLGNPITWSPWMTAIDSWQEVSVSATVPAGSVTVFIYSTQSQPKSQNQNYYDQSVLAVTSGAPPIGTGSAPVSSGTPNVPPPPTSTPVQLAPSVNAQPTLESGRVEHRVQQGDTLAAISVAYGVPASEILALNNLTNQQARFIQPGQVLLIAEGNPNPPTTEAEVTAEAQEVAAVNTEGTGFVAPTAQEAVASNTPESSPTPEFSPTPENTPTPTDLPATPTDAPDAPVEEGSSSDPLNVEAGVCLVMFADGNSNNIQDAGEEALTGGTIRIKDSTGADVAEYITDGSEPHCLDELPAAMYTVNATAPDGYGLPRSALSLSVQPGAQFTLSFPAVAGLQVAVVPTTSASSNETPEIVDESTADSSFRNIAGIIILGLAGVVLVGGIGVAVLISRRK
jgi:LysM repeat protein